MPHSTAGTVKDRQSRLLVKPSRSPAPQSPAPVSCRCVVTLFPSVPLGRILQNTPDWDTAPVLVTSTVVMNTRERQLREGFTGAHNPRLQSVMMERAWLQKAAGPSASAVGKQGGMDTGALSFLFSPVPLLMEQCHLHPGQVIRLNLPSLDTPSATCPEIVSTMILNSHQTDNQDQLSLFPF